MKSSTRFHFFLMVVLKAMHKTWISAALAGGLRYWQALFGRSSALQPL
jgi:thiosulfate reductase cytochrome b subunit